MINTVNLFNYLHIMICQICQVVEMLFTIIIHTECIQSHYKPPQFNCKINTPDKQLSMVLQNQFENYRPWIRLMFPATTCLVSDWLVRSVG